MVLGLLLVLAAGCELQLSADVTVDPDGGGTVALTIDADPVLVDEAAQAGVDPLARVVARIDALDGPWAADLEVPEDGGQVVTVSTGFADPAELQARWEELRVALDTPEATLLGPLQVTLDEEARELAVAGEVALQVGEVAAADLGTTVEQLTADLAGVVTSQLVVHGPGPLLTGGDGAVVAYEEVDGEGPVTLTWTATPGQRQPVEALVQVPSSTWLDLLLPAGVGLLALLAIGGGVMAQRRR